MRWVNLKWKIVYEKPYLERSIHYVICTCYKMIHFRETLLFFLRCWILNTGNQSIMNFIVLFFCIALYNFPYGHSTISYDVDGQVYDSPPITLKSWNNLTFVLVITFNNSTNVFLYQNKHIFNVFYFL